MYRIELSEDGFNWCYWTDLTALELSFFASIYDGWIKVATKR